LAMAVMLGILPSISWAEGTTVLRENWVTGTHVIPAASGMNASSVDRGSVYAQEIANLADPEEIGAVPATSFTYQGITSLWASGACSGYLKSDGTCDVPSGGTGIDWPLAVTATEVGYLDGLTGSIATSLNGKLGATAKAADSTLFDGHAASYFQVAGSYLTSESDPLTNALGKATLAPSNNQTVKWNGSAWVVSDFPASGDMLKTENLSGLSSTATARTNLGLGTAATANTGTTIGTLPLLVDDGSGNASLAISGINLPTLGAYSANGTSIDANADGKIDSGFLPEATGGASSLAELSDWPTDVSATEVGYLNGLTGNIQAQINGLTVGSLPSLDDDPAAPEDGYAWYNRTDHTLNVAQWEGHTKFSGTFTAWDQDPTQFSFTDVEDVELSTVYLSNGITVAGMNHAADINATGDAGYGYTINSALAADCTSQNGVVVVGDVVRACVTSSALNSTAKSTTVTIGPNISDEYSVTTVAVYDTDSTFDAFGGYTAVTDATVSTPYVSANAYTVAGVDHATPVSVTGDTGFGYKKNSGLYCNGWHGCQWRYGGCLCDFKCR